MFLAENEKISPSARTAFDRSNAYFCFRSDLGKAQFAAFVSLFASPVAVPSVPMVQEMNGDVTLAGQLVVWSTLVGAFSIFLAAFFLRLGGAL